MKTLQLSIFCLIFILLASCKKKELYNEVRTVEDAYKVIVGEWEWEKTTTIDRINQTEHITTPQTENTIIRSTFTKNLKYNIEEIIDNNRTSTDYGYTITIDTSGEDGYGGTFYLTLTNIKTKEQHLSIFLFKNKNTLVFFDRSLPFTNYYTRK